MGSPSGPIYDELANAYHITPGTGTEASTGFDVLIYDGETVTPEQIESFATTNNFLLTGKILVVLNPTQADRQALEEVTGVAALVDSPALAVFNGYSNDALLQTANMVDFPTSSDEDPIPAPDSEDPAGASESAQASAPGGDVDVDSATLRARTNQWRKLYESKYMETRRTLGTLSGIAPAQFAAAAVDDGSATPAPNSAESTASNMELDDFLSPSPQLPPAQGSQFLTAQPFFHYLTRTLNLQSIYFQPRFDYNFYFTQAISNRFPVPRGLCTFLPDLAQFIGNRFTTSTTLNVETATYRLLQKPTGGTSYNHEIVARHWIQSVPNISTDSPVTERVSYCNARLQRGGTYECIPDGFGCNAFLEDYPLKSMRGFNAQLTSSYSWDPVSTSQLTLLSALPEAENKDSKVKSSQSYDRTVSWSIQGAVKAKVGIKTKGGSGPKIGPNVGVSFSGRYGETEKWHWSEDLTTFIKDWEVKTPVTTPQASNFDFFAQTGVNNQANLVAFSNTPADPENPAPLSFDPKELTGLQQSRLVQRDDSDWSTKFTGLLPAGQATLNASLTMNYGEVYNLYTSVSALSAGLYTYGTLHPFTVNIPIGIDFSVAIMRPPLPATWTVSTELNTTAINGYFPITGTVTLDEPLDINTVILLGAQLEPSGNSFIPTASVIQDLPLSLTIFAGQTTGTFTARARRVGSPYNVQFYGFQTQGEQAGDGGQTVPAR